MLIKITDRVPEVGQPVKIIGHGFSIYASLDDKGIFRAKVGGRDRDRELEEVVYWEPE